MSTRTGSAFNNSLLVAASEAVWRQLVNLHYAMADIARNDPDDDPVALEQWRFQKECEYLGGLDVFSYVAVPAGLDITVPHPSGGSGWVFSLKRAQDVLVDWARTTGRKFPPNFTESAATLHI